MAQTVVGQSINLVLQLEGSATDRFPRAILRDADGVLLAASPVELSHVGEGLYSNDDTIMPDTDFVTAVFEVFNDALYTVESIDFIPGSASERFDKQYDTAIALGKLDQIITNIQNVSGSLATVDMEILATQLDGTIVLAKELKAELGDNELSVTIDSEKEIAGTIEEQNLDIKIDKC